MSLTGKDTGDKLKHLKLRISLEVLDDAFKYHIVSRGCYGAVYRITHDGALCAAKYRDFDDAYKPKQFQQECLLHSKLHHPNIVQMLGVCYYSNIPIKVMELLGSNLQSFVYQFPATPVYVKLTVIQDVSRGLDYLHTHNPPIVHCYLTMQVILLTANLVAKIGGFTFSIEMVPEIKKLPAYCRETFKSALYYGPSFDIYSFGCVICETITNKRFTLYKCHIDDGIGRMFSIHNVNVSECKYYINCVQDASLKQLVIDCLNDNVGLRPSALVISKRIGDFIKECYAKDSNIKKAYLMAMKEGQAESRDLQVLLVGAENTGKSCLVSSFLGEEFVEGQVTTKGADMEVCRIYCKQWTKISHSDRTEHLQYQFINHCKCDAIIKMSTRSTSIDVEEANDPGSVVVPTTQSEVLPDLVSYDMQDIAQSAPPKAAHYDPESLNVTLWDFAGQVIFHNTHSVFISEEGVPIITFDASVELTSEILNLRDNSSPLHEKSTGISSIHYWLQVIDSICSVEGSEGDLSPLLPTALLAATHIDKLHHDIKEARKIAKKMILPVLEKELRKKPYAQHLAGSRKGLMAALEEFCFFISNKVRDEEIERLKNTTVKAAASLRKKQPIFFLKIERALLSHNEQVISKSKFLEIIAQSLFALDENSAEFKGILRYFHNKRVILHFSQVKSLQDLVILSPRWLVKLFSYVITAHSFVTMGCDLDEACERLANYGILQENLLEHMLRKFHSDYTSAVPVSYQQVVDILLCFHLIACITKEAFFSEEGFPSLPDYGDVFIVPSLVPRDEAKMPPSTKQERIIYFMFNNGFVPVSLLNQLIADCIYRNVQRKDQLLWMRHGKVGLQLGSHQKYYINHCTYDRRESIQLTITAVGDDVDSVQEREELINDVTKLLDDVMKVFMPNATGPILLVPCPLCPTLHVSLHDVQSGNTIFCPLSDDTALPTDYYSDISKDQTTGKDNRNVSHKFDETFLIAEKKLEVFTDYYSKLMSVLPIKMLTSHLVTKRIISFEEEEEIIQAPSQSQSTRLVLMKIACSLQAGLVCNFDELLIVMEQYGNLSCVELVKEMRQKLLNL